MAARWALVRWLAVGWPWLECSASQRAYLGEGFVLDQPAAVLGIIASGSREARHRAGLFRLARLAVSLRGPLEATDRFFKGLGLGGGVFFGIAALVGA